MKEKEEFKKKKSYTKVLLSLMFVFLLMFITICLYITFKTGSEPSTLIMSVFAFCGLEGGLTAWIKTTQDKINNENKKKLDDTESQEMEE